MTDEIHAFLDSNIFLHYRPLAQIDWCGQLKAGSVTLMICLTVIDELDEKKSDPRLADRAKRALKEVDEYGTPAKPLRANVTLEIYNEEQRRDELPSSLSPYSKDNRIVQLVMRYIAAHPERKVCILTEDFGMLTRCKARGVPAERIDPSDRLENPGEDKDRKLKHALAEVATLKNQLP